MQSFPGGASILLNRREAKRLGLSAERLPKAGPKEIRRAVFFLRNKLLRRFGAEPCGEPVSVRILPQRGGCCAVLFWTAQKAEGLLFCFPDSCALIDAALRFGVRNAGAAVESALYLRKEGYYLSLRPKAGERGRCAAHFAEYGTPLPAFALFEPFLAEHAVVLEARDALGLLMRYFSE